MKRVSFVCFVAMAIIVGLMITFETGTTNAEVINAEDLADKSCKISNTMYSEAHSIVDICETIGVSKSDANTRVVVALIDTGVYPHIELTQPKNRVIEFVDLVNCLTELYDDNGHGTALAGIIAANGYNDNRMRGVSNSADLVCIKALDYMGRGDVDTIINAIKWAIDNRQKYDIKIINLSFGITFESDPIKSRALIDAVDIASDAGILVITAVGNKINGRSYKYSPADSHKAIAVGSSRLNYSDGMQSISDFTSVWDGETGNTKPDVLAPGENVLVLSSDVYYRPDRDDTQSGVDKCTVLTGSSEAAAIISGIAAEIWSENPSLSNLDVANILLSLS